MSREHRNHTQVREDNTRSKHRCTGTTVRYTFLHGEVIFASFFLPPHHHHHHHHHHQTFLSSPNFSSSISSLWRCSADSPLRTHHVYSTFFFSLLPIYNNLLKSIPISLPGEIQLCQCIHIFLTRGKGLSIPLCVWGIQFYRKRDAHIEKGWKDDWMTQGGDRKHIWTRKAK